MELEVGHDSLLPSDMLLALGDMLFREHQVGVGMAHEGVTVVANGCCASILPLRRHPSTRSSPPRTRRSPARGGCSISRFTAESAERVSAAAALMPELRDPWLGRSALLDKGDGIVGVD